MKFNNTLYVEVPFCPSRCRYCVWHKGIGSQKEADGYVGKLLPDFLKRPDIKADLFSREYLDIYFGGGSPSFARARHWDKVFRLLPLKKCKVRCFEGAIRSFTGEHARVCAGHNFDYISIGIQSFSRRILKKNNRYFASLEKIKRIVNQIEKAGMICNLDLLCGIDKGDERDVAGFIRELKFAMTEVRPVSITVNVQMLSPRPFFLRQALLRELRALGPFKGYECVSGRLDMPSFDAMYPINMAEYRFMRARKDFLFRMVGSYITSEYYNFMNYSIYDLRKYDRILYSGAQVSDLVKKSYRLFVDFRKSKKLPYY